MKRETIYPPIQMLKDYSEQGDLTWEQLEEIRAVLQSRINRSGRPYITLLETLFAMNCVHEIPMHQRKEAARIATEFVLWPHGGLASRSIILKRKWNCSFISR